MQKIWTIVCKGFLLVVLQVLVVLQEQLKIAVFGCEFDFLMNILFFRYRH